MKKSASILCLIIISGLQLTIGSGNTIKAFAPRAINDTIECIYEDSTTLIDCFSNDFNSANGQGGIQDVPIIITPPKHGTAIIDNHPDVKYIPNSNYYNVISETFVDSFQYEFNFYSLNDNSIIVTDTAWVFIDSIAGVNEAPIANLDSFKTTQGDGPLHLAPLTNDEDPDLAGLNFNILNAPKHGTLSYPNPLLDGKHLFFPNNGFSYNTNLQLDYELRDKSYLNDTVLIYTPDPKYFGYDSLQYIISEYRPGSLPPIPTMTKEYTFVYDTDADTATIIFFIEAKDYIPVAINDTVILKEQDEKTTPTSFWRPENNDLDADTISDVPSVVFNMPYILKDTNDLSTAVRLPIQQINFEHDIHVYDETTRQMVVKQITNTATLIAGRLQYTYAPYYSGVDSLFYIITEKELDDTKYRYPNKFRKDTSNFGVFYFVVTPSNQLPYANPDTIVFDWDKVDTLNTGHLGQYCDVLANDIDIDTISREDIANFERFTKEDMSYLLQYDSTYVVKKEDTLYTNVRPKIGKALCYGDSVYYRFEPPYKKEYMIDSFEYFVLDASRSAHHTWVYVTNTPAHAQEINFQVNEPFLENRADSTIGSNIALIGANNDRLHVVTIGDTVTTPSKSSYAEILDAKDGNVNYMYHKGFTTSDRFQYIISDYLTFDTAWVNITNTPCIANTDTFVLSENPFSADYSLSRWEEIANIKDNDIDQEGIKYIIPLGTDTIETAGVKVWLENEEMVITLKKEFFYKDSILYKLTDLPAFFADKDLFTQDSAWLYIIDKNGIVDSDGDGIPNLMENGIAGYQVDEDTLNSDNDTLANYLDIDADNDGLKDNGDCDNDGILNFLDLSPGCNEIEVSNVFTPNNDGINDHFVIKEIQLSTDSVIAASIHIYDRYGMLVYENDAYGQNNDWWDGTMGDTKSLSFGDELPNAIYVYYIEYNGIKQQGYVHIQK